MKIADKILEKEERENKVEEKNFGLEDSFIKEVAKLLDDNEFEKLQEQCENLPPEDAFELIMKLNHNRRRKFVETLEGHSKNVYHVTFSPDGRYPRCDQSTLLINMV